MPRTDAAIVKPRVAQHPVRERKALAEDKGGEGELFALEKLMQVRRCHPLRDCGQRSGRSCRRVLPLDIRAFAERRAHPLAGRQGASSVLPTGLSVA